MFDYRYEGFIEKLSVSFTLIYLIFFIIHINVSRTIFSN